jgi:hypothetical protein
LGWLVARQVSVGVANDHLKELKVDGREIAVSASLEGALVAHGGKRSIVCGPAERLKNDINLSDGGEGEVIHLRHVQETAKAGETNRARFVGAKAEIFNLSTINLLCARVKGGA